MNRSNSFITALQTPGALFSILENLRRQKSFIKKNILPFLEEAVQSRDGSFDNEDLKKITNYYGLAVPAVLGEAFCALRGKKMSGAERLACTCLGAITGMGDDFFDKDRLGEEELKNLLTHPEDATGKTAGEKLSLYFYKTAILNAPDRQLMQRSLFRVFLAQVESRLQKKNNLTPEEIKNITLNKGGVSLLFYRTVFSDQLEDAEERMLYSLGGLMQLSNDIFDVYKDITDGVNTLMTTANKVNDVRVLFSELLKEGYEAAYKTGYEIANIKKFISIISIGIFSRCYVCLDHLEKSERLSNDLFTPQLYNRKQLICDMDTSGNKWKSVWYHLRTV